MPKHKRARSAVPFGRSLEKKAVIQESKQTQVIVDTPEQFISMKHIQKSKGLNYLQDDSNTQMIKDKKIIQDVSFLRRLQLDGREGVYINAETENLIYAYEAKDAEKDRILKAKEILKKLTRKVGPSLIQSGEARVGKKGSEYADPLKYIPDDINDLVAEKLP